MAGLCLVSNQCGQDAVMRLRYWCYWEDTGLASRRSWVRILAEHHRIVAWASYLHSYGSSRGSEGNIGVRGEMIPLTGALKAPSPER